MEVDSAASSPASGATRPDSQDVVPSTGVAESVYRATLEDFVLWAVIAAVLAYFAWYLHAATATLDKMTDIERLALYGLNIRADLVLLLGAALALLGCMIVLRRVRTSFSAHAGLERMRARLIADSAGVVIVVLGVALLAIVVTHPPRFERGNSSSSAHSGSSTEANVGSSLGEWMDQIRYQQAHDHLDKGSGSAQ